MKHDGRNWGTRAGILSFLSKRPMSVVRKHGRKNDRNQPRSVVHAITFYMWIMGISLLIIIMKQKWYGRLIAIKDSKKDLAFMLPKTAGLSILPLVGQNGFPHVTRIESKAPIPRFDTLGPAYAGPNIITFSIGQFDCP